MKYLRNIAAIYITFSFIIFLGGCSLLPDTPKKYELVWSDEFDVPGTPNPLYWNYEEGFVRNMELQWYYPSNAWCENGTLIIEGRREQYANPGYDPGSSDWRKQREYAEYTSSSLKTQGLLSWQYGRFEMKAKFKTENGLWPAFWSLGITGEWPSCGEVDIMEYYGGNLLANVAWGTDTRWVAEWDSSHASIAGFGDPDWSDKFHIWRMDWDKNSIKLYVDDILLNTANLSQTINPNLSWGPSNPFRQPHYIIVNLAIGGTAGGDPSATDFPTRYEIDYIRVYQ